MALEETFADHFETTAECVRKKCAFGNVGWSLYRISQTEYGERARVIWIPTGGDTSDDTTAGERAHPNHANRLFRLGLKDSLRVEIRIIAPSWVEAETIRRNILAAIRLEASPETAEIGGYRYMTQDDGEASAMHGGAQVCIQDLTLHQYIPTEISPTHVITSVTHTCDLQTP